MTIHWQLLFIPVSSLRRSTMEPKCWSSIRIHVVAWCVRVTFAAKDEKIRTRKHAGPIYARACTATGNERCFCRMQCRPGVSNDWNPYSWATVQSWKTLALVHLCPVSVQDSTLPKDVIRQIAQVSFGLNGLNFSSLQEMVSDLDIEQYVDLSVWLYSG